MKKIFTSFILVFTLPFKLLRKTKIDNFVGGLIFGALFSLVVNIITIQIQEAIQKQRVLEAIENEIVFNAINAKGAAEANQKEAKTKNTPNMYYTPVEYSNKIWTNSEALKYVVQLDPKVQSELQIYYEFSVKRKNEMMQKNDEIRKVKLADCSFDFAKLPASKAKDCLDYSQYLLNSDAETSWGVVNDSFNILKIFHPTQDRLNNWWLKLLLGDKSVRILSGK